MKKLISLLLALILVCSLLPLSAMAADNDDPAPEPPQVNEGENGGTATPKKPAKKSKKDSDEDKIPYHDSAADHKDLFWNSNAKYHWKECGCGARLGVELHVDPLDTADDYCFCGYHFSDNADLVTLWVDGCPCIKNFNKAKTEYKLNAYTYKDVKEIKIATRTYDSEATVELPEDLTLKEGENKFDVKVVSENKKVTKVYTLIITKEAKK